MLKKILIVEDNISTQKLLAEMVKSLPYETQLASNGAEGLYYYLRERENYVVVLLDLMMPEVTGDDFLRIVESLHYRGVFQVQPHIIVETAVQNYAHLKRLAQYESVAAICKKPLQEEELLDNILKIADKQ